MTDVPGLPTREVDQRSTTPEGETSGALRVMKLVVNAPGPET
jgi:hypothetical protein